MLVIIHRKSNAYSKEGALVHAFLFAAGLPMGVRAVKTCWRTRSLLLMEINLVHFLDAIWKPLRTAQVRTRNFGCLEQIQLVCLQGPTPLSPWTKMESSFRSKSKASKPIVSIRSWQSSQNGTGQAKKVTLERVVASMLDLFVRCLQRRSWCVT